MKDVSLLTQIYPIAFILFAAFTGALIGKVKFKDFSLGESGALVSGIFLAPLFQKVAKYISLHIKNNPSSISGWYLQISLMLFIASVGLLAAKKLKTVLKQHGVKFAILGIVITFAGALASYAAFLALDSVDRGHAAGVYVGALTSSPGLASALETAAEAIPKGSINAYTSEVGLGYALSYPIGVFAVILSIKLLPMLFKINIKREINAYKAEVGNEEIHKSHDAAQSPSTITSSLGLATCCLLGYMLGKINIPLCGTNFFKLGTTGGVLLTSLFLGYKGNIYLLSFHANEKLLTKIRSLSLLFFLATVGLKYGGTFFGSLDSGALAILLASLLIGLISITTGFLLGRYLFKMNWVLLVGAICGGMTSTPGLGASLEAIKSNDPVLGYGATYPFALLGMVLFTKLIFRLPAL